jgi:hypothetical protein
MLELKINPAKYAQYKLLYKDKSFDFVVKPPASPVIGSCKAKVRSVNQIVKVASVTWDKLELLLKIKW